MKDSMMMSPKIKKTYLPNLPDRQENDVNLLEENSSNENDAQDSTKMRMTLSCPKHPKTMIKMKG